jgi:hypothetical protein
VSFGAARPWTREQFIAASSASSAAVKRRSTALLKWFFGATLINFAALGLGVLAIGRIDKLIVFGLVVSIAGLYVLFIIIFAVYIAATARSHARRHGLACQACAAAIPLEVLQFERGRLRAERIENLQPDRFPLNCSACGARIANGP